MVAEEVKFVESEKILAKIIKRFVKCAHSREVLGIVPHFSLTPVSSPHVSACERESFHMIGLTLWKNCLKEIFHQRNHFIQS